MSETNCSLCGKPVNKDTAWKEVTGWVGGPRKDSMRLRQDTGKFAHDSCVEKVSSGLPPEQETLFEAPDNLAAPEPMTDTSQDLTGFLFGKE